MCFHGDLQLLLSNAVLSSGDQTIYVTKWMKNFPDKFRLKLPELSSRSKAPVLSCQS